MRSLAFIFAVLILSACVNPAATGPAGQDPNAWQTRGCIDKTLPACVADIGASLAVDDKHIVPSVADADKVDLDGRHVYADKVEIPAYIPAVPQLAIITAYQNQSGVVISAGAFLKSDLLHVVSADDFHKTGFFPALSAIYGAECPDLTEAGLARTFYDEMKPKIVTDDEDGQPVRKRSKDVLRQHIPAFQLCGHHVLISSQSGDDRRKISPTNPTGTYAETLITVK